MNIFPAAPKIASPHLPWPWGVTCNSRSRMKFIPIVIMLFSSSFSFSQKVVSEEITALGDSFLSADFGEVTLGKSYAIDKDSYILYQTKSGKKKSRFLDKKQLDKSQFNYAQLVYNIDIEYPKCPEYPLLSTYVILHVDSTYSVKSVDNSDDYNLPPFYWKNDSCAVLDSSIVRSMVDSIGFKNGQREILISLKYSAKSKQLEWVLDNLLWQQLEPRISRNEIVILDAATGKFIKRYEYQYPPGSGM